MAITSLTPAQKAARSTVALKALMAVSGLIMIGYLLAHMYGNLKVFAGPDAFNDYAHHLRTLGEPILPHTRAALDHPRRAAWSASSAHAYFGRRPVARANKAPRRRVGATQTKRAKRGVQRTYASFTLRWGGVIILLFVVYHLLHLTFNVDPSRRRRRPSPYDRVVNGFQIWWVVLSLHDRHARGRLPPAARHLERPDHARRQHLSASRAAGSTCWRTRSPA